MPTALNDKVAHLAHRRPHRALRASAVALGVLAAAMTLAACAGGSSPGVANLGNSHSSRPSGSASASSGNASAGGGTSTASGGGLSVHVAISAGSRKASLKFAKCMRKNGVSNFPDPSAGGSFQFGSSGGIDARSTQFQAAMQKCRNDLQIPHVTPAQLQAGRAAAVRFSQCMRSHGVSNFPDPQFGPGGRVSLKVGGPGSGLDPNSPAFQRAMETCGGRSGAGVRSVPG
jgi:hypothetical protein